MANKARLVSVKQEGRFGFDAEGVTVHQVRSGKAVCRTEQGRYELLEQGFLILNAKQAYEIEVLDAQTQYLAVQVPNTTTRFEESFHPRCVSVDAQLSALALHGLKQESVEKLTEAIETLAIAKSPEFFLLERSRKNSELPTQMRIAREFVLQNLDRPIGLHDMAEVACLSPFHFHRRFTHWHGVTPHEFLRFQRIRWASRNLILKSMTIEEVARASGFESTTSFAGAFRSITGLRPTQFRKLKEVWRERLAWFIPN